MESVIFFDKVAASSMKSPIPHLGVFERFESKKLFFPLFFQKKSVAYFVPWIKNGSSGHEEFFFVFIVNLDLA